MEHSVQSQQVLAAVDLGSNSFHMVMARLINGQLQIIDQRGEKVQLAAGLDPVHGIAEDAQERALACLKRFGQHLRGLNPYLVTILGTNTLRAAPNSSGFMQKAKKVLGFPIEVISGIEEARLVYLGVAHTLADDDGKRLVIDIGGGSTEFIIGERFAPLRMESLSLGCVTFTDRFFAQGHLTEAAFSYAIAAAKRELFQIKAMYRRIGWQNVVGSSGTMRATSRVLVNYGLAEEGINLKALVALKKMLVQQKSISIN
ncbi:Ppx/GppA phosphatase family protein [Pseudomonas sp. HK3]